MCGLVGVAANHYLAEVNLDVFRWLLYLDATRGEDSTGVAFKRSRVGVWKPTTALVKTEGLPSKLYRKFPEYFNSFGEFEDSKKYNFCYIMGHNRSATIGSINAENAHPFHHGTIVGAHNGTIHTGLARLPTGEEIQGQTDSEKIIFALSKGVALKDIVDKLSGAIALSWYDSKDDTYHLFRNKDRPLFYYTNPLNSAVTYASEAWMLKLAFSKAKLVMVGEPIALLENEHIAFKLGQKDLVITKEVLQPPFVATTAHHHSTGMGYYQSGYGAFTPKVKAPKYFVENGADTGTAGNVIPFASVKPQSGWLKLELTKPEFDKVCRHGCVVCSADLYYDEYLKGDVKWLEKDSPFCLDCSKTFKEPEKAVG